MFAWTSRIQYIVFFRMPHPPSSPNISPGDLWLIGILKEIPKDQERTSSNESEDTTTMTWNRLTLDDAQNVFRNWTRRLASIIEKCASIFMSKMKFVCSCLLNAEIGVGPGTFLPLLYWVYEDTGCSLIWSRFFQTIGWAERNTRRNSLPLWRKESKNPDECNAIFVSRGWNLPVLTKPAILKIPENPLHAPFRNRARQETGNS
jgi:hypothetical protein